MSLGAERSHSKEPRNKPILSIRARLMLLALLAVVPLMLDRVRLLEARRAERSEIAASQAMDIAKQGVERQREIITTARALLQATARVYATVAKDPERCTRFLSGFAVDIPWLKSVSILDARGRGICSSFEETLGRDFSDRPYFRDALRKRDFVLSDFFVGRIRHEPVTIAAYPVQAIDPANGAVVIASIDLSWIDKLAHALDQRGATILLVDGKGTVLAGYPNVGTWVGKPLGNASLAQTILAADHGTTRFDGLDGVPRIFSFLRLPSSSARLVVGLDEAAILERVDGEIGAAYLQLAFFGLLALLAAWFGGEQFIVAPIRALARKATLLGSGELDVRPGQEVWLAEFEPLAEAMNDMAHRLAERERELRSKNRHLTELASIDGLSGLANRRGFDARLEAEWERAAARGMPLALLMIDIDRFKLFNDFYGHVEGDVCLRRVGKALAAVARAQDFTARYGGEEFALLLPDTDCAQARVIAERLRQTVEDLGITHSGAPRGYLTLSVGVASLMPGDGQTPARLIEFADAALYAAKRQGRNAIVASPLTSAVVEFPKAS